LKRRNGNGLNTGIERTQTFAGQICAVGQVLSVAEKVKIQLLGEPEKHDYPATVTGWALCNPSTKTF
jgi:hypothetical protein